MDSKTQTTERTPKQYIAKIAFDNGRETPPFPIAAFDFHGAMAKLTGMASDQPGTILAIQLALVTEKPLIVPGSEAEVNFWGRKRGAA